MMSFKGEMTDEEMTNDKMTNGGMTNDQMVYGGFYHEEGVLSTNWA